MPIEEMKKRPDYFDDGFGEDSAGGWFERFAKEKPMLAMGSALLLNLVLAGIVFAGFYFTMVYGK